MRTITFINPQEDIGKLLFKIMRVLPTYLRDRVAVIEFNCYEEYRGKEYPLYFVLDREDKLLAMVLVLKSKAICELHR